MGTNTAQSKEDRNARKRVAARIRQQRCRARKREAKLAENRMLPKATIAKFERGASNMMSVRIYPSIHNNRNPTSRPPATTFLPRGAYPNSRQEEMWKTIPQPIWSFRERIPVGTRRWETILEPVIVSKEATPHALESDRLQSNEETAIAAMLSLQKSNSCTTTRSPLMKEQWAVTPFSQAIYSSSHS